MRMPVLLVDRPEVVHVDADREERDRLFLAHRASQLPREKILQPSPISQAGQAIHRRGALEVSLEARGFGQDEVVVPHASGKNAEEISREVG